MSIPGAQWSWGPLPNARPGGTVVPGVQWSWGPLLGACPRGMVVLGAPPRCPSWRRSGPGGPSWVPVPGVQWSWGPLPDACPGGTGVLGAPPGCQSRGCGDPGGPSWMPVLGCWYPARRCWAPYTQPCIPCPACLWGPFLCCPPPVATPVSLLVPQPVPATQAAPQPPPSPTESPHHECPRWMPYIWAQWPASLGCIVLITGLGGVFHCLLSVSSSWDVLHKGVNFEIVLSSKQERVTVHYS